eukprot:jgi/Mesvir1/12468/Mv00619-RA.1
MGMGKKQKPIIPAVKSDIKYIKCQVCEETAKRISRAVKKERDARLPKKLTELEIIEMIEKTCEPEKTEGAWIKHMDLVTEGTSVKLHEHENPGKCRSECQTVARTCKEVLGDHDTDLAELLFKGEMQRAQLTRHLCNELSGACTGKVPKLGKSGRADEEFLELSEKEAQMEALMASLGGMDGMDGMGLNMYDKDSLLAEMEEGEGTDGIDDYLGGGSQGGAGFGDNDASMEKLKQQISDMAKDAVRRSKAGGDDSNDGGLLGKLDRLVGQVAGVAMQGVEAVTEAMRSAASWGFKLLAGEEEDRPTQPVVQDL